MGHFPQVWKRARIALIRKKGENANLPVSYRPISLISNPSKTVDKIILESIKNFILERDILPQEQFSFRANHSTVHQTTRLATSIIQGFNFRKHTGAIFLDVSKAFDKVWHNALALKMIRLGFPDYLIRVIISYLNNRSFVVSMDGQTSDPRPISAGVPQGSSLAPVLFNIYTHDIPKNDYTELFLFADDTAITSTAKNPDQITARLQRILDIVARWMQDWKIQINPAKTKAIFFTKSPVTRPNRRITLNNVGIDWVNQVKYLGLVFDKRLTWCENTKFLLRKGHGQFMMLYSLLNRKSLLNVRNKLLLYKIFIRPVITFGCPTWNCGKKYLHRKIQTFQNKMLRIIINAPWFVRNSIIARDLDQESIEDFFDRTIENYFAKANITNNQKVINSHITSPARKPHRYPKDWLTRQRLAQHNPIN